MRLGQLVYFRVEGIIKIGFVSREEGTDDLIIICEKDTYKRHHWEIKKVPDKKD